MPAARAASSPMRLSSMTTHLRDTAASSAAEQQSIEWRLFEPCECDVRGERLCMFGEATSTHWLSGYAADISSRLSGHRAAL